MKRDALGASCEFSYYGPRSGFRRRRGVAFGRILALEPELDVVHVQTYLGDEDQALEIGHLPLATAAFDRSLHRLSGPSEWIWDGAESLARWRERHARGEVGAFSVDLWEAERLIWETVEGRSPSDTFVEYGFPKLGESGKLSVIEVSCVDRAVE